MAKPPTAFIAAIAVLLVLPLLIALGIGVIGLSAGMPDTDPGLSRVVLIGFVVWMVLVAIGIAVFLTRLLRKSPRS